MPPPSLGKKLKQAREHQGLSLADVAHKTRIPAPRLKDMEEDHYNSFGSLTYARSFLQTYAKFVGVDANSVTDHMNPTPLGGARDYRYLTESLGRWIGLDTDRSLMPDAPPVRTYRVATFVVAVFGAVLIGGVLLARAYFKSPTLESNSKVSLVSRDYSNGDKETRPAPTSRTAPTENVPIRRALPVEDDAKPDARK